MSPTSTTSSARTAATARWAPTATPASAARRADARTAASRTCSSCSTTITRRRTPPSSPATREGRIVDCGRGLVRADRAEDRGRRSGARSREALGLRFEDGVDHVETALEWEVRVNGKPVEVHAERDRAGQGGRRHLPGLRRRGGRRAGRADADQPPVMRRIAAVATLGRRPLASTTTDDRSPAPRLRPAPRRRAADRLSGRDRGSRRGQGQEDRARPRPQGRRRARLPGRAERRRRQTSRRRRSSARSTSCATASTSSASPSRRSRPRAATRSPSACRT